jgi:hypothetical protein
VKNISRGCVSRMGLVAATLVAARGGTAAAQSSGGAAASATAAREATISVIPQATRVCPGQSIHVKYVERLPDGTQTDLSAGDVKPRAPSDFDAATMNRDGSWQTNADPLRSVATGFRLSVSLARDSTVRGDTVVAPSYDCLAPVIRLPATGMREASTAYVRLGTFRTPFYDSVVVAVVEIDTRVMAVSVLSPMATHAGAIKIAAPGGKGSPGRNGRTGMDGSDCSNGDDGEDGLPGDRGWPGRAVNIIVEQGARWLADIVTVSNPGGPGGQGGKGGNGGMPSVTRSTPTSGRGAGSSTCRPRSGRPGRTAPNGPDGPAGDAPKITSVLPQLLWSGSPIWSDAAARQSIEALMAFEAKPR